MSIHHSRGPFTLKDLSDFHVWPLKHRHWSFELAEDEDHAVWIRTADLRSFFDKFASDKDLKSVYHNGVLYAKDTKTHYVTERIMRNELRKSKGHPSHTDVLKFLDWFDRNVTQVAAKKRSNARHEVANQSRHENGATIHVGPIGAHKAPPQLEATTLPFTKDEAWLRDQSVDGPKRVFHPDVRPIRTTWKSFTGEKILIVLDYLLSFWRGKRNLFWTFCAMLLVVRIPAWCFNVLAPESLDWTVSYRRVMWAFALVVPIALACAVVYFLSLARATKRSWGLPGGKLWATTFFFLVAPMTPWVVLSNYDQEMLEYWWASVRGDYHPVTAYADPHLGRIVIRGPMEFGSAEALQEVLNKNPKFTLIQIESPGGFAIEGMRMAQMVLRNKLDTVAMERCSSACTLVLAAGVDRYLGPEVRVGFHRSGTRYGPVGTGWNDTDHRMASYLTERGVKLSFIEKALTPSIRQLWVAPHPEMFESGYATLRWSERKNGY